MTPQLAEGLRLLAFADAGQVRNHQAGAGIVAQQGASSVGLGLRYQWRQNLSLAVDWAYVLDGADTTGKHDNRAHAALSVRY